MNPLNSEERKQLCSTFLPSLKIMPVGSFSTPQCLHSALACTKSISQKSTSRFEEAARLYLGSMTLHAEHQGA